MKFRGGEFSTGTMGNFQPELTPVQAEMAPVRSSEVLGSVRSDSCTGQTEGHDPWSLAIRRERLAVSRRESIALTGTEHRVLRLTSASSVRGLALVKSWPATGSTKASGHYPTAGSWDHLFPDTRFTGLFP